MNDKVEIAPAEPGSSVGAKLAGVVNVLFAVFLMFMVRLDSSWGHNPNSPDHVWQMALAIGLLVVAIWGWVSRAGGRVSTAVALVMAGLALIALMMPSLVAAIF